MGTTNKNISNYDWDIESLLDGKSVDEKINEWKEKINDVIKNYNNGKCFLEKNSFSTFLQKLDNFEITNNKLMNYISNKLNENLTDKEIIGWNQHLTIFKTKYETELANFDKQVVKNKKKIIEYLKDKNLSKYTRIFKLIFRNEPHMLSEKEEKLLAKISPLNFCPENIYTTLANTNLKFKPVLNKNNKLKKISTEADIIRFLMSKDRVLRKNAFIEFGSAYERYKDTFSLTLYYNYLGYNINAKLKKHKDYISEIAFNDEIDPSFIKFVYENVANYNDLYKKFLKVVKSNIKKKFKFKKVMPWDTKILLFKSKETYSIEETKKIVTMALKPLGDEYIKNVKKAFNEKWISWLPKPNKVSGAYSIGETKGLDKYFILMNFDKTIKSVYTIAHELGHSMHSLASSKQPVHVNTSIFYAEISSITNEMILSEYLLKANQNNKKRKLIILNELISNFFAATSLQICFSEFEYLTNDYINQGKPFHANTAIDIYASLMTKYLGKSQSEIEKIKKSKTLSKNLYHIFRISHFYSGVFYVYKYAIGQVAGLLNAKRIINNEPLALKRFNNFLESGGSISPLDTIKLLDIDLTKRSPWEEAYEIINKYINEYIRLSKEIKW